MLHLGYEVWVEDEGGRRIPEYKVQTEGEDGTTIAAYIPSESGKRFVIRWKDHHGPTSHYTSMRVSVDGAPAGKTHMSPGGAGKRVGVSTESASSYRPFQFADLQTTDDDGASWGSGDALGTISLRVVPVQAAAKKAKFRPTSFAGVGAVHERSKKAGAHCVSLGEAKSYSREHHRVRSIPLTKGALPCAVFVFRYRPPAILQAQDIMPANVAGPSSSTPRARPSGAGVKKERRAGPSSAKPEPAPGRVKSEPKAAAAAAPAAATLGGGDVIDLSDSEDERDPNDIVPRRAVKREYDPGDVIDLTVDE